MAANTNRRINIYINGKEVENKIGGVQEAYNRLGRELKQLEIGSDAYNKKAMEIQKLKSVLDEHNVAIGKTASGWDKMKGNLISTGFGVLGGNILTTLTTKVSGFFGGMIDGAAKLSDQFADIRKTTGMSADEVKNLNKELKKIDTRTSVDDLRNIAIVAGQLGIEKEKVKGFAESIDIVNVALGDEIKGGAGAVAETVGKLRNVLTDMKSDAVDKDLLKIGNALNELGAAGFATAPVVADISNRIGAIAIPLGFTSAQVMGLAATFQELNISEERGGTAMGKILQKMTQNTADFAKVAGMEVKGFTKLVNTDLYGAFMKVVEGSRKGGSSATLMSGIIKELEVNGAGASEVFMKLSGNVGMANEKIELAAKALQSTDSVMNEFGLKNNNFAGQMAKAGKEISSFFFGIGQKISPIVASVVSGFADLLGWLKRNCDAVLFLGKGLLVAGTAYVSYSAAVKLAAFLTKSSTEATLLNMIVEKANMVAQKASTAMLYLKLVAIDLYKGKITLATAATEAFNLVTKASPIGLLVAGVTAAATAYMVFKKNVAETTDINKDYNEILKSNTEKIYKEKYEINSLIREIIQLNENSELRKKLLKDLQDKYPEYLKNINIEKVTNAQLLEILNQVNETYAQKIKLAAIQAKEEAIQKKMIENEKRKLDIEEELANLRSKAITSGTADDKKMKELESEYEKISGTNKMLETQLTDISKRANQIKEEIGDQSEQSLKKRLDGLKYSISVTNQNLQDATDQDNKEKIKFFTDALKQYTEQKSLIEEQLKSLQKNINQKNQNNGGNATGVPTDEEKKALEDFNKEMKKLREDRNQSYMDADKKELRQVDLKYQELIEKAKKNGQSTAEIEKLWAGEIEQIKDNQFKKRAEKEFKEEEETENRKKIANKKYIDELEKTLNEASTIQRNQIKQDYIDGKITKEQYDEKIKQQEITQLQHLIELKKKFGEDTLALEEELKNKLIALMEGEDKKNAKDKTGFFDNLFGIDEFEITDKFRRIFDEIIQMASELGNIWGSVLQIQANNEEKEFRKFSKSQDDKKKLLDKRLKSGLISQKQYDDEITKIDNETEARQKQMAYDQAVRDKNLAIFNAVINTAAAVVKALPNIILAAIVGAAGAAQVALIASQPLPELAEGGFTDGISIAGEKGTEWVASNSLLKDKKTAPVISWLESYQRGNRRMNMPVIPNFDMMAIAVNSRWNSNASNGQNIVVQSDIEVQKLLKLLISASEENKEEIKQLNTYLSDPNNRKARIVRDELTRFDNEISVLQGLARIGK